MAVFTALSLGSTQAFAQAPSAAPDRTRSADAPLAVDAPEPGPDIAPAPEPTPDIAPAPEPEPLPPPQAEPAPPPEPMMGPAPPPSPEPLPAQHNPVRAQKLRNAGIGTMIAGGVVSVLGFGLTLAFTMQGRKRHGEQALAEDENSRKDCSRMPSKECTSLAVQIDDLGKQVDSANRNAQIGGAAMLTGFAVLAVGGLLYRIGVRRMQPPSLGRLKLSPSLGGVVLSGRF